uniref:DNA2/NAM7 helicase-like C-terminal domain-containing protein n=1 Tax=Panagrolaimus superbus TaxID=310955 RepID=A0A914YP26_9BILA
MANYISHIVIDEAGRMPFIEALNIVVETPNLKQLILNGDIQQYPYHHRIRLEQRPECYDNVLKMINLKSSELSYIQLNSTFLMHPGLVKIMNEIFYPNRNLIPLFPPESLDLCHHFRHPNIPIAFHAVEGGDELFPPTSRRNQHQNYIGIKIIQQLFENYHPAHQFRAGKILVLCNYSGQRRMMQEALKEKGYDRWVKVKCVDNVVGEHSDIVIYITTRAYDSEFKSIEEQEASGSEF